MHTEMDNDRGREGSFRSPVSTAWHPWAWTSTHWPLPPAPRPLFPALQGDG